MKSPIYFTVETGPNLVPSEPDIEAMRALTHGIPGLHVEMLPNGTFRASVMVEEESEGDAAWPRARDLVVAAIEASGARIDPLHMKWGSDIDPR
jgi:hypothetical protein